MTRPFELKICGLSTEDTVSAAINGGASMIGLVFFEPSPRHVDYGRARDLALHARSENSELNIVALTVDADDARVRAIEEAIQPDIFQLHGKEPPERLDSLRRVTRAKLMKAIGLKLEEDLKRIHRYLGSSDLFLLDAKPPRDSLIPGGNGAAFNWSLLDHLTPDMVNGKPVLLAGGLRTENVADAVKLCCNKPHITGLDVSSGVESAPGRKDPKLIESFLAEARRAREQNETLRV